MKLFTRIFLVWILFLILDTACYFSTPRSLRWHQIDLHPVTTLAPGYGFWIAYEYYLEDSE